MNKYPPLALDAAVKAVLRLCPENDAARDAIAAALRLMAPMVARREPPPPPPDEPPPPVRPPDAPSKPQVADGKTPASRRGPRCTRLYPLPRRAAPALPAWTTSHAAYQPPVPRPVAPPEPLFPRRTARGVLKAMLATVNPDERVDIAKALEMLARAAPVAAWPRRLGLNMARGAALLVDTGPGLEPFRDDLRVLIESVRTVVGADRLQVHSFASWPPAVFPFGAMRRSTGDGDEDEAVQLPAAGTPVLVVSDFGHIVPRATRRIWLRFAAAIRAAGCEPIGLVPVPPNQWDRDLAAAYTLIHWERDTTARAARHARQSVRRPARGAPDAQRRQPDDDTVKLALALAPATRIDRALLRAMRREVLPMSSPVIEARFWRSEMIGSRGELAVTWDAEAVKALRKELRDARVKADDPPLRVVSRMHGTAPPLQQLEVRLIALDIARPADWEDKVNRLLRGILLKLIQAPKREAIEIARWAIRAMTGIGFDPPEQARETARELLYAATLRVGRLPQAQGPLQVGADVPAWIPRAISGTGLEPTPATLPVTVQWRSGELRIGGDAPGDGHEIDVAATALPALAVTWEQPDATAPAADQWVPVRGTAAVRPPNGETPPPAAVLTAQDGARWRIEDADRADALAPLRVLAVMDEKDEERFRDRFAEWAVELRLRTGLHDSVPILARSVRLAAMPKLPDRSLWRGIQRELVDWASHVIVVLSEAIVSPKWTWEVLRFVDDKLKLGAGYGSIIAFVPDASTRIAENKRFDALRKEFPWLAGALLVEPEASTRAFSFSDLSEPLLAAWRKGNALHAPKQFDAMEPRVAQDFAHALQWAALSFHVQAFEPGPVRDGGRVDRKFYGLNRLPQAGQSVRDLLPVPELHEREFDDQAEVDFDHVRFQAEYLFGQRVAGYLNGGQDPSVPALEAVEFQRRASAVIRRHLAAIPPDADERAAPSDEPSGGDVADALRAFRRFANAGAKDRFIERFGDFDAVGRILFDGISDPDRTARADLLRNLIDGEAEFAQLLWPFSAEIYQWRLRFPASFAASRTFPEYLEALTGLLVHYLRGAAEQSPETLVECRYPISESADGLMREAFRSSFVSTELMRPPRSPTTTRPTDVVLRLPNFADLAARLCDAVMWGVRAEAARRLARQPAEPIAEEEEPEEEGREEEVEAPVVGVTPLRRIALVIGNARYQYLPALSMPVHDTARVAAALRDAGFDVVHATDLRQSEQIERLRSFARSAEQADCALIYFAGHGAQVGQANYLFPIDAETTANRTAFEGVAVGDVIRAVGGARRLRVVLLDAGNDNGVDPLPERQIRSGSPPTGAVEGTVVIHSAGIGEAAVEFENGSPFASAFVERMREPGLDIQGLFGKIRDDVGAATGRRQNPSMQARFSGGGRFYLTGETDTRENAAQSPDPVLASEVATATGMSGAAGVSETPKGQSSKAAKKRVAAKKEAAKKSAAGKKKVAKKAAAPPATKAPRSSTRSRTKTARRKMKKRK